MAELNKAALFDPELVKDLILKVQGASALAALCNQTPIPFNGEKEFVFTMDSDVDIVAESGKKSHGGISVAPVIVSPYKIEYGARVSDEFMKASTEQQIATLKAFSEGFARKLAAGLDKMAIHGINPRSGEASDVIGNNCFDKKVTQKVVYDAAAPDAKIEAAITLVEDNEGDVTGIAISNKARSDLAAMTKQNGEKLYPEFAFGGKPTNLGANALAINKTVSAGNVDHAIVGDFANMFKWGYADKINTEVIEYGDPDNSGKDLKGYGQVYIRAEAFIGWGIFDSDSFARVTSA